MQLYVIRHAIAEERRPGLPDADRALTERGRRRMRSVVAGLQQLEVGFDLLCHSPWLRAVQTAELLVPLSRGERRASEALAAPPGPELLEELRGAHVAVVGHQPWLAELVAWLVLGTDAAGGAFSLGKGGMAWLEGEPHPACMVLRGLFTPRSLRQMAPGGA